MSFALACGLVLVFTTLALAAYRRFASRARELSEARFQLQLILDHTSDGIVILDRNQNVILNNQAAASLLRAPGPRLSSSWMLEQLESLSPTGELVPPESWPGARAVRGEFVRDFRLLFRNRLTGDLGSREVSTTPVPPRPGHIGEFILSFRSDTARRSLDDAVLRLAAIVEGSDDAIIANNSSGIITDWNQAAERIFGYPASVMIGRPLHQLLPPDRLHEEDEILQRILSGQKVFHFNTLRLTADGRSIDVSLTISPIRDAAGEVIGASKIARDITETRSLERQLRQSQRMDAVGQLTGGVAHDFNNLLGVVIGNLDLLESLVGGNQPAMQCAQTAQKAAMRGADLTRRLLTLSSAEQLKPAAAPLHTAISNTISMARSTLGPDIEISMDLDESMPPAFIDSAGLEGALLNLIVNARDAMPRGGALRIAAHLCHLGADDPQVLTGSIPSGPYACVSVTDTGQGMSPDTLERAFEPFFTTKARNRGTGLGLAMVYGFVKQSLGSVKLQSAPGHGTTVSLYLPLADSTPSQAALTLANHTRNRTPTILVVDDEADLLALAVTFLETVGYNTLHAQDGESAIRIVAESQGIDLLLTDIIMPGGIDGVTLARSIHLLQPGIKVVYTSGFSAHNLAQRSLAPVDGPLLRKPYRLAELQAVIRQTLDQVQDDPRLPLPQQINLQLNA